MYSCSMIIRKNTERLPKISRDLNNAQKIVLIRYKPNMKSYSRKHYVRNAANDYSSDERKSNPDFGNLKLQKICIFVNKTHSSSYDLSKYRRRYENDESIETEDKAWSGFGQSSKRSFFGVKRRHNGHAAVTHKFDNEKKCQTALLRGGEFRIRPENEKCLRLIRVKCGFWET